MSLVALGALLGAWHNHQVDRGRTDVVVTVVRGAIAPPALLLRRTSIWIGRETGWVFRGRRDAIANRALRRRVVELRDENLRLREAQVDLDRLRADLGFVRRFSAQPLGADVVGIRPDPRFDTLVIACGGAAGARPDGVVIAPGGLVGRILDVGRTTSSVLMLTDQNSGVGARVLRPESRAVGVCKGDNTGLLSMMYLSIDADVRPGDAIVTSGLGGLYPAGIPIGTVTEVRRGEGELSKIARVRTAVDFAHLEEVYLLR
jgi:rod shape-determining protein MreC